MNRYDEARSLLDLALEKLGESTPTKETSAQFEEATNAMTDLGYLLDSEKPSENEVEPSRPLDPRNDDGVLLARGKAEVESLVLDPGSDVLIRVIAPAGSDVKPAETFTIGSIRLERLANAGIRLSSDDTTYWEGEELAEEGTSDFIFRVMLGDVETGWFQPLVQLVHLPVLDMAKEGYVVQTATFDAADSQVKVWCADDLIDVIVGTTQNVVLDIS